MKKIVFTLLLLLSISTLYAQVTYKTHTVEKGENLTQIARKYYTTADDIRRLNPGISAELNENQALKVPNREGAKLHQVQPKETLYAISKKYQVTINQLNDWNPILLTDGLQTNQTIIVSPAHAITSGVSEYLPYTIKKGETIYSIAVKSKMTVSEIYELNPSISGQKINEGDEILLPKNSPLLSSQPLRRTAQKVNENTVLAQEIKTVEVEPGQTIYSISRANDISIEELVNLNPEIKNGLKPGMILKLTNISNQEARLPLQETAESLVVMEQKENIKEAIIAKDRKEIAFLLPFNNNYINIEENKLVLNRKLQKDVFLNMTLDFYSGVLMALDSAQYFDFPIDVKIIDSKESNRNMQINQLLAENDFKQTDVIVGPFFQSNVDALSEALKNQATYIISPLSTDAGKGFINQVHAMPTNELLKKGMMDYLKRKGGNILYLSHNQESVDFGNSSGMVLTINEKGNNLSAQALKNALQQYSTNYVVLDSNSLEAAINITNILHGLRGDFNLHLVLLDRSSIIDTSEISIQTLADLKTTFPSVTADFDNYKYNEFHDKFYEKYQRTPNRFAVRGFDITLDVLQRLRQAKSSDSGIFDKNSEQIENAFEYQNSESGIYNSGIYILYFDTDLSIRNAY